mgnify:CR=1 FL=1
MFENYYVILISDGIRRKFEGSNSVGYSCAIDEFI